MRFRVWDRFLAAVSGLLIILLGLVLAVIGCGLLPSMDLSFIYGPFELWQRAVIIAVAVLVVLLGIHGLWMLLRRRTEKGFIMQRTDMGDMSISMSALSNMVRKCVDQHREVETRHIRLHRVRNGVIVDLKILLANGINIPLTVNVLQKQIKQYITSCSGIDVQEVRVKVETSKHAVEETAPVDEQHVQVPPVARQEEPVVELAAESILRHTEEPADYVEMPVSTQVEVPAQPETVAETVETVVEEVAETAQETVEETVEVVAEEVAAVTEETVETAAEEAEEIIADVQEAQADPFAAIVEEATEWLNEETNHNSENAEGVAE